MKVIYTLIFLTLSFLSGLCFLGCGRSFGDRDAKVGGDTITEMASLLTIVDYDDYMVADIRNPWDSAALLQRYVLLPDTDSSVMSIPSGTVVRVPLKKSLVYSGVHAGAIAELGRISAIKGVADADYFTVADIRDGLKKGLVADVGSSMSPDVEKVTELDPDAILASPYQNAGYGIVEDLGIPVIECADYMEPTPLGRAEWIKLLGVLYGNLSEAENIFGKVKVRYEALVESVENDRQNRPKVITERVINGVWFVPGGRSYMSRLITDAGGVNPWMDTSDKGSLQLDFSSVLDRACDSDIWLIRNLGPLSLGELESSYSLNAEIKAFKDGEVYVADTSTCTLFDDFPFHPEKLLKEYIHIFHPELRAEGDTAVYYKRIR